MSMQLMMACTSHSPLLYFPARESETVLAVRAALREQRRRIEAFSPELIVLFGNDHYGGHQMASMPAFSVGVEATALADVGGTPGPLNVPREAAVGAVNALRREGVDVAVSYAMEVDHGFSQVLEMLTGGIDVYPVLPIFVSCIQPPFVPFRRARALGAAVGRFATTLPYERILFIGTGGLAHNPEPAFPPIDKVSDEWRPYHLLGKRQNTVPQQKWIDYQIDIHKQGAVMFTDDSVSLEAYGMKDYWDKAFLKIFCSGDLSAYDEWKPESVVENAGIGAMEVLSWIAAVQAMQSATGSNPQVMFHACCREVGVGFGIAEAAPALAQSPRRAVPRVDARPEAASNR